LNVVDDTTPRLGGTLDANSKQVRHSKGVDVASNVTLTLGTDGNSFDITGTDTITSISTLAVGTLVVLHFDGILILTHHATSLILPTAANITTAPGDIALMYEYDAGLWRCASYTRADGTALAGGGSSTSWVLFDVIPQAVSLTTGDGKYTFRVPSAFNGMNLVGAESHVYEYSTLGLPTVQIYNPTKAADIFSTKLTIDDLEKDSSTAATPVVIDSANDDVLTGDELRIDIDVAGTGTKGMTLALGFQTP